MCISRTYFLLGSLAFVSVAAIGCNSSPSSPSNEAATTQATDTNNSMDAELAAAIGELPEADRAAAKAQRYCTVEQSNLLGSMGKPFKLMVEGQPVFLCCEGCKDAALRDPQATLAAVAKLKQANSPRQ